MTSWTHPQHPLVMLPSNHPTRRAHSGNLTNEQTRAKVIMSSDGLESKTHASLDCVRPRSGRMERNLPDYLTLLFVRVLRTGSFQHTPIETAKARLS
jgi:hypothetical protein